MSFEQFLDAQEDASQRGPQKPFWALDFDNEDDLLEWLNTEMDYLKNQAQERHLNQRKNLAVFRGIQYQAQDRRSRDEAANESTLQKRSKNPRAVFNHIVDMVEQDVSRMTKYRGAVSATAPSDENDDRIVAEIAEELIEKFWNKNEIDYLMQKHSRRKRIFSEDYIGIFWNKNLGPYHPDWVAEVFKRVGITEDPRQLKPGQIRKIFREKIKEIPRLPLLNPDGKPVLGDNGKPLEIDRPVRLGDVQYKLIFSWDMFLQRRDEYERVEYGGFRERVKVDTLKAQHPSKAGKIEPDAQARSYDAESCEDLERNDEVEVFHFFHKSTDELDQGRYIKFCRTAVLTNKPNPYLGFDDKAILPWVRTVDIETPAVLNGDSVVTFGRGPQAIYNNLTSLKVRNRFLFAHPKWFMPKGAVKVESLANQTTVVQYKGAVPPVLAQANLNEASDSEFMQETKNDMQQIMGVYGVSRGEPPKGVVAAVAMTFLDEQESERANVGVAAHTRTLKGMAQQTLWLMADHYEDDEGRLESLLGRNRAYQAKKFSMANLRDIADLMIQNTSALPQQKSARIQYILDIKKEFPGIVQDDMAVDILGLGEVDRLRSVVTVALRKAEDENNSMMNGVEPSDPKPFEYHLAHYRTHIRQMNEPSYEYLPKESKDLFEGHVMAHEMEMWKIGQRLPPFMGLVMQEFPQFPCFFVPENEMPIGDQGEGGEGSEGGGGAPLMPAQAMPPQVMPPDAMPQQIPTDETPIPPGAGLAMPQDPAVNPGQDIQSPPVGG